MYKKAKILCSGDKAVVVEFGNSINEEINMKVRSMMIALEKSKHNFITEMVPTYRSLLVNYDPLKISYGKLENMLRETEKKLSYIDIPRPNIIEIPVCYDDEYGEDLVNVANHNNLTNEEVVNIHTKRKYLIYMLGFTPGFAYLGGMDERIATPRLSKPRIKINAGSVGIAGAQTGIYPVDSPGGWQIIGRTPLKLFNKQKENPILLEAGNYIKFIKISKQEYEKINKEVLEDVYEVNTYHMEEVSS